MGQYPSRIVCLTEETTETLYLLGMGDCIVGVSGYTARPAAARKKPRVSAFTHARYDRIEQLNPDLILGFSDLQSDMAAELIRRSYPVVVFNQRSVAEILQMIRMLGGLVGCAERAEALAASLQRNLDEIQEEGARFAFSPRVFFEEWDEPLISGIRWVEELIAIAGGEPIFPELITGGLAKQRIVAADEVVRRNPDVIIASWCGKPVQRERIEARAGWNRIAAVRHGHVHEVKSTIILQPGPAALTDGVRAVQSILQRVTCGSRMPEGRRTGLQEAT